MTSPTTCNNRIPSSKVAEQDKTGIVHTGFGALAANMCLQEASLVEPVAEVQENLISSSNSSPSHPNGFKYGVLKGADEHSNPAVYGAKETHPIFDGSFVEVDGLITASSLQQKRRPTRRAGRRPN